MALLNDVNLGALGDDSQDQIKSLVKQINEQGRLISNEDRTKIIKDASGTPRILFGEGPDQFYGMKVSQEGIDVTSANNDELVFNSDQNVFKIVQTGTASVTKPATTTSGTQTIAHNLGYAPQIIAYLYDSDDNTYNPTPVMGISWSGANAGKFNILYEAFVDNTNIYLRVITPDTGANTLYTNAYTFSFKYYLLQESAS